MAQFDPILQVSGSALIQSKQEPTPVRELQCNIDAFWKSFSDHSFNSSRSRIGSMDVHLVKIEPLTVPPGRRRPAEN